MRVLVIAALALLALPAAVPAADVVINLPTGWRAEPQPVQYRAGTLAVLVGPVAGGPATHVMAWRAGLMTLAPMPSRPAGLEVSADGQLILVGSLSTTGPGLESSSGVNTIINTAGTVVATSTDPYGRAFGLTSTRLLAWNMDAAPGKFELSVYNLTGTRLGRVKPSLRVIDAVMVAEPAIVAYATGGDVTGIDPTHVPSAELWQAHLVGNEYAIVGLRQLSPGRMLVEQSWGWWKALSTDGQWLYTYDPVALDAADPAHGWEYYAGFVAYATPNPNWLILVDESPDALLLNIVTGQILPFPINTSVPPGFTRAAQVKDYSFVFVGANSVRIRPLPALPSF